MDLFKAANSQTQQELPLAERLRPKLPDDMVNLAKNSGPWRIVWKALEGNGLSTNLIFWGPPGTGKTSLAHVLAQTLLARFCFENAVSLGSREIRAFGEEARHLKMVNGEKTILFIDEIHRLNKGQQDILLPYTERGDFTLIGATTENPSYELNSALLSRCQVVVFERHSDLSLKLLLEKAAQELHFDLNKLMPEAMNLLIAESDGDARRLLSQLECLDAVLKSEVEHLNLALISSDDLKTLLAPRKTGYQKTGDDHYDTISAFIKSVRGSDPDAAIYYLARMLDGGEDPVFIARRLVILASEDIGNADPRGLSIAVAGLQAVELIGLPEAAISLAQVTTYLSSAPKSNASYMALRSAEAEVKATGRLPVPLSLRSSRTKLNKDMGYGAGYQYSHNGPKGFINQVFLPQGLESTQFYKPKSIGFEKTIIQFMEWLRGKKGSHDNDSP